MTLIRLCDIQKNECKNCAFGSNKGHSDSNYLLLSSMHDNLVSISSTFYVQIFCMNGSFFSSYMYIVKVVETMFERKMRWYNFDEIEPLSPLK